MTSMRPTPNAYASHRRETRFIAGLPYLADRAHAGVRQGVHNSGRENEQFRSACRQESRPTVKQGIPSVKMRVTEKLRRAFQSFGDTVPKLLQLRLVADRVGSGAK
jgi:hypothetical protein